MFKPFHAEIVAAFNETCVLGGRLCPSAALFVLHVCGLPFIVLKFGSQGLAKFLHSFLHAKTLERGAPLDRDEMITPMFTMVRHVEEIGYFRWSSGIWKVLFVAEKENGNPIELLIIYNPGKFIPRVLHATDIGLRRVLNVNQCVSSPIVMSVQWAHLVPPSQIPSCDLMSIKIKRFDIKTNRRNCYDPLPFGVLHSVEK
mmetsp:Transcript_51422/g.78117  ORF Transcript_51422/g.78117 Transcript_51422/m.78117 type:complete len:200 (+) Transcript_51422:906-1505(+)